VHDFRLRGKVAAPLTVAFTDTSTGSLTSWLWSFGDGATSTLQHPTHTYTVSDTYTVTLTIDGQYGGDTEIKTDYITVLSGAGILTFLPLTMR